MKANLSSIEVTYLVKELQELVGAKVEKIFQTDKPKEDFLFSLHVPSSGKRYLYVSLPNLLCLTSFKPSFPQVPPAFCASLRRKITNAKITAINQVGFERIIQIDFTTKNGPSQLIIELLPPGNIVLILPEEENKIIAVLHAKIWSDERKILPNKTYTFPPSQLDPRTLSLEDFTKLVNQSDKDSVVKTLAIETSLGGLFAKEVLFESNVEQTIKPNEISKDQTKLIFDSLQALFTKEISATIVDGDALAFPLHSFACGEKKDSFNDAIATIALSSLETQEVKEQNKSSKEELSKVQKVIKAQSSTLQNLEKTQEEKRKKGELIYANYNDINNLLHDILDLRKTHTWAEIKHHFQDHPLNVKIDEKQGTITVELDE
ncbi:NFACT family protein [Candidatus Woesearchaeota archaeon]|nr:NFACT family protein [Candidatus Woesearchaeota archaeon]